MRVYSSSAEPALQAIWASQVCLTSSQRYVGELARLLRSAKLLPRSQENPVSQHFGLPYIFFEEWTKAFIA